MHRQTIPEHRHRLPGSRYRPRGAAGSDRLVALQRAADSAPQVQRLAGLGLIASPGAPLQREHYRLRDMTGNAKMRELGDYLNEDVLRAKAIVDANPQLEGVANRDRGYLGAWRWAFDEFLSGGVIPEFFYARYGYAVETLATAFFKTRQVAPYSIHEQLTYGATRPDIVIRDQFGHDHAWLDITSEGSPGHIYRKAGGGWHSRPYVAEIRYDMPSPADFATSATGTLTSEQIGALRAANEARAEEERDFQYGRERLAVLLSEAFDQHFEDHGAFGKVAARAVALEFCRLHLANYMPVGRSLEPRHAKGVLAKLDRIDAGNTTDTGQSWAQWVFKNASVDSDTARRAIVAYARGAREGRDPTTRR